MSEPSAAELGRRCIACIKAIPSLKWYWQLYLELWTLFIIWIVGVSLVFMTASDRGLNVLNYQSRMQGYPTRYVHITVTPHMVMSYED